MSEKGNKIEKDMHDVQDGEKEFLPHSALQELAVFPYLGLADKGAAIVI
ncbi:MAG TPA: hypothetical protein VGJ00_09845 [Rhabdochlamydiaceae bacterium]|jgi:hypothetical protein